MKTDLDRTDLAILNLLTKNGRATNKEVATHAGLAPSSAHARLRRLNDTGVLRGIHADIDPAALGLSVQALFMIELAKHDRALVEGFLEETLTIPEVIAVYLVSGRFDVLVHAALRDTDHMRDLAFDAFTVRQEVVKIETSLVFSHARKTAWPDPVDAGTEL